MGPKYHFFTKTQRCIFILHSIFLIKSWTLFFSLVFVAWNKSISTAQEQSRGSPHSPKENLLFHPVFFPNILFSSLSFFFFPQSNPHLLSPTAPLFLLASFFLLCPPRRGSLGQTSLVVSSVDFLETLRETEGLMSDYISVKDTESWHCLICIW